MITVNCFIGGTMRIYDTIPICCNTNVMVWRGSQCHHVGREMTPYCKTDREFESLDRVLVSEGQLCGHSRQTSYQTTWSDPPHSVTAQQPAFLPDKPQPVCVLDRERQRRGIQVSTQTKGTGVRDRRCRVAWGCGQVVTHLSLLAQEGLVSHRRTSMHISLTMCPDMQC